MRELRIETVADDGSHLVLSDAAGETFHLEVDERLRRSVRSAAASPSVPPVPPAQPNLNPRDIQAQVRAGASPEAVAEAAGLDPERVRAYARPVLAERTHVAEQATGAPVDGRPLREVVVERLAAAGMAADDLHWDASLREGQWQVVLGYATANGPESGTWDFMPASQALEPRDDVARWLVGRGQRPGTTTIDEPAAPIRDDPRKQRRVPVPSWDEILLGGDRPGPSGRS